MCRTMPYLFDGQSTDYMYNHCGKKSIAIDMKKDGALELVMKLAKVSDVVVENFRPGVMKRLGIDYKAFKEINPSIIMCSISGWGQSGLIRSSWVLISRHRLIAGYSTSPAQRAAARVS